MFFLCLGVETLRSSFSLASTKQHLFLRFHESHQNKQQISDYAPTFGMVLFRIQNFSELSYSINPQKSFIQSLTFSNHSSEKIPFSRKLSSNPRSTEKPFPKEGKHSIWITEKREKNILLCAYWAGLLLFFSC